MKTIDHVQAVITNQQKNKVLLIKKRDLKKDDNCWLFVKGTVEEGESELRTLAREIIEEVGLRSIKILHEIEKYHYFYPENIKHIVRAYLVIANENEEINLEDNPTAEKILDCKWVNINKALPMLRYDRKRLQKVMEWIKKSSKVIRKLEK